MNLNKFLRVRSSQIPAIFFTIIFAIPIMYNSCSNVSFDRSPTAADASAVNKDSVGTISINGGAKYTDLTYVLLALNADAGTTQMYITSDAGCAGGGYWEPYATSRGWTLAT